jgi:hypothetical protein
MADGGELAFPVHGSLQHDQERVRRRKRELETVRQCAFSCRR